MATNPETYGAMPATGYMRQSQLIPAIFPFSSATLWRKVKAGTFPKPVKLGPRITAWRVEDIREQLSTAGHQASSAPPKFGQNAA
jgi:prophage regulatory protein